MTAAAKTSQLQGRSLDPENHTKLPWWRTRRDRSRRRSVRLCIVSRDEFGNIRRGNVSRKFVSGTRGCGHALRPLQEAAAMLIPTRHTAGSELEPSRIRGGLAKPRTAWMASGHYVVVPAHLSGISRAGCTCPACMASIGAMAISTQATMTTSNAAAMDFLNIRFLLSQIEVSQIDRKLAVTTITARPDARRGRCPDLPCAELYPTRFSNAARNSRKRNVYPLAPSFPGSTRWLASNNSSAAIEPKASRSANSGTGKNAGRPKAEASTFVNSALRTGFGATKFTGPESKSVRIA